MPTIEPPFLAVGGNRHPAAADWSSHGTLAFGAGRCVALWSPDDPSLRGVQTTLKAHRERVNAVRFLPGQPPDDEIILSGSVDKTICIWRHCGPAFSLVARIEGVHNSSINEIATCAQHCSLLASASADGTVAIFSLAVSPDAVDVKHLQSLATKPKFYPLCLALAALPASDSGLVLAVGGSTHTIHVYVSSSAGSAFAHQATLSGHENWVRSLTFTHEDPSSRDSDLILASSSQDRYIRLWRVHPGEELPPASANSKSKTYGPSARLSNKAHMLRLPPSSHVWSLTFEALLMGHEDWVYTASWNPTAKSSQSLRLLSCSADNSISIWAPEESSGIWAPVHRFGEISDLKGASTATGSAGGIWNCLWSPSGSAVTALTKNGSWRVWRYDSAADRWNPAIGITGHTKDATGISWAPDGSYLASTSLDQTTRLFSRWTSSGSGSWHEFSRPQIHGYDINCIASVAINRFVSGADEKLLRVFDEPQAIATLIENCCGITTSIDKSSLPNAANIPVLGLSNKSVDRSAAAPMTDGHEPDVGVEDEEGNLAIKPENLLPEFTPPLENQLSRHTLWPETEKLYGHGYEISALAAAPGSQLIATACKASTVDHAVIRIYDGDNQWRETKPALQSHALTVTAMAFSSSGKRLLSVGRDRAWSVFVRDGEGRWGLEERRDKAHTRIIYDCTWMPGDTSVFITVSRDKNLKIWKRTESKGWECKITEKFAAPITAVDVLGDVVGGTCWVVVGLEDGGLELFAVDEGTWENMARVQKFDNTITPDKAITGITWRPGGYGREREVAVASEDGSVRIYRVVLELA